MVEAGASILRDGVLLLGFGLVFVLLFRRLGLGATLGWLVAGAVVGPQVLGLAGNAGELNHVAELGITLLLFIVGLELSPSRLWAMKGEIFGLGLAQVVLCGLALFALVYLASSFTSAAALAIGLPLALSSTAQVLPMLQSAGRLRSPFGERAFAILLFQDLSLIPLLTIIAALSRYPADTEGPPGWQMALLTLAAIAGLILAGRFLVRPLFRLISTLGDFERRRRRIEFGFGNHSLLNQSRGAVAVVSSLIEHSARLPHSRCLFRIDAIVSTVRRKPETRARLS